MSMVKSAYSHRNGERNIPTVAGDFGFRPNDSKHGWIIHVVEYSPGEMRQISSTDYEEQYKELEDGQYWGPIVGPWQTGNGITVTVLTPPRCRHCGDFVA